MLTDLTNSSVRLFKNLLVLKHQKVLFPLGSHDPDPSSLAQIPVLPKNSDRLQRQHSNGPARLVHDRHNFELVPAHEHHISTCAFDCDPLHIGKFGLKWLQSAFQKLRVLLHLLLAVGLDEHLFGQLDLQALVC